MRVFIASSNDLKDERVKLENLLFRKKYDPIVWENIDHSITQEKFQDKINKNHLTKSDIVIFMVKSKLGEFTQEEFEVAYSNLGKSIQKMYIYFIDYDKNKMEKRERRKIDRLQEFLENKGDLYQEVEDYKSLENHFLKQKEFIDNNEIDNSKNIQINPEQKDIKVIPKICIYTASPLNHSIEHKLKSVLNLFKKYEVDITHKILTENELLEYRDYDFNLLFTKANKEKIIIENEYFMQKSITLNQLEDIIDTNKSILFLDKTIDNSQFNIKKKISKEIVGFLHDNFKDNKGHSQDHPLKTQLPDAIDIGKLNGFIGRATDIEAITRKILTIKDEHQILTIKGAGGLGKTTLISKVATEIAKRGKYKDGIEFVNCEYIKDYEDFENKITFAFSMSNARNFKEQLKEIYDDEDRLIILDNIETLLNIDDTKEIKELIHFISNYATIVITSREILKENGFEEVYDLKELSTDEAEELFLSIYKMKKYEKKELRIDILENKLSNNPLAITLVANNLSKGKNTYQIKKELDDNFISMTTKDLEEIFDRDSDNNIERLKSLFSSINYSYIKLSEKEKLAIELLSLFPDGIHFEDFKKFYNQKLDKEITNKDERIKKLQEISSIKTESFGDKHLKSLEDKSLIINNNQYINLQSIIGRFAHFIFDNKKEKIKIEYYEKAYLYKSYLLSILQNKNIHTSLRSQVLDNNKNNFLKCLEYIKYLKLDFNKFDFIDDLCNLFQFTSPNKQIFEKLKVLKNTILEDKNQKEFFEIQILCLQFYYYNFDDVYNTICKKYSIKKIHQNYKEATGIKRLNIDTLLCIYDMEGKQMEHIRLSLSKKSLSLSIFDIGEYKILKQYIEKYPLSSQSMKFDFYLNTNSINMLALKKYLSSLYKTQIIEKIQTTYVLLKANVLEVKLRYIKKLVVSNPFTDGLKTLMLAMKYNNKSSKLMFEQAIQKLYHIKYYHVEAIHLYSKYLKYYKDKDYNEWFRKGIELSKKHYYRCLEHKFICLDSEIDIEYNEENYPLPEKLDYSKIIKSYSLKGL